MNKIKVSEEISEYFAMLGKKSGEAHKIRSKEKYGDENEYFRRISAKRKRFGRLPKKKTS